MSQENLDSFIEKLPNSCGNTKLSTNDSSCNNSNCPDLTLDELQNFCFYESNCKLNCPDNVNMNNNLVPKENDTTIIDTFTGSNNLGISKKYYDPNVFTFEGFSERFHDIATKITYPRVHNSLASKYNKIISYTPLKDFRHRLLYDRDKDTIENLQSSSSGDGSNSTSSCSSSSYSCCCLILIGVAVYFYMKSQHPSVVAAREHGKKFMSSIHSSSS